MTNSKQKGSRGERQCRDIWKKHGYEEAHRSQQYSGRGESSADLEGIDPRLHIEVKSGYSFKTIYTFLEQAVQDAKEGQTPIVNCKMDRMPWLWVCYLDDGIDMWKNQSEMIPIIPMELKKELHIDDVDDFKPRIIGNVEVVVRCKDCRYRNNTKVNEKGFEVCTVSGMDITDDDYCSFGERAEQTEVEIKPFDAKEVFSEMFEHLPKDHPLHKDKHDYKPHGRLIDADALRSMFDRDSNGYCASWEFCDKPEDIQFIIDSAPTVEVQLPRYVTLGEDSTVEPIGRPHGEWLEVHNSIVKSWFCSKCGNITASHTDYCAVCGADMRGDDNV